VTKYFCDYCGKELTKGVGAYRIFWEPKPEPHWADICHDCYFRIRGFVKTLKEGWDPRKAGI